MAGFAAREITSDTSTERTQRLKQRYLDAEMRLDLSWPLYITEYFKKTDGQPIIERRAGAFRYTLEKLTPYIRDEELIVGSQTKYIRGSHPYPEFAVKWIKEELEREPDQEEEKVFQVGEGGGIAREHTFIVYKYTEEDKEQGFQGVFRERRRVAGAKRRSASSRHTQCAVCLLRHTE